jgi:ABC-type amino acid transport substrate-binding protein
MKKSTKKIIAIVLALALVLSLSIALVACNDEDNEKNNLLFGNELTTLTSQIDILTQLKNGSADIGVMDSIMAGYYMTTGTYAQDLQLIENFVLAEEEYGIAAKKGNSALISKINEALIALAANGSMSAIGDTFGLTSEIIVDSQTTNPNASAADNSWTNLVSDGTLVIGYTLFAPIAYTDDANGGALTGYDIELAKAVVSYLNVTYNASITIDFQVITWSQKETMLQNGSIDLVWNGLTINDERLAAMEISVPYLRNKQVAVIRKTDVLKYSSLSAFLTNARNAIVAVENGSAAQECMEIK